MEEAAPDPLVLRALNWRALSFSGLALAPTLPLLLGAALTGDPLNVFEWTFIGFTACMSALMAMVGLTTVELRVDERGIHHRQFRLNATYLWEDVVEIGVGRDRTQDGWDHPAARLVVGKPPMKLPPRVGINLKIGDRNAATVAYRRGITGFEINLPDVFPIGVGVLAEQLQERLEHARRSAS